MQRHQKVSKLLSTTRAPAHIPSVNIATCAPKPQSKLFDPFVKSASPQLPMTRACSSPPHDCGACYVFKRRSTLGTGSPHPKPKQPVPGPSKVVPSWVASRYFIFLPKVSMPNPEKNYTGRSRYAPPSYSPQKGALTRETHPGGPNASYPTLWLQGLRQGGYQKPWFVGSFCLCGLLGPLIPLCARMDLSDPSQGSSSANSDDRTGVTLVSLIGSFYRFGVLVGWYMIDLYGRCRVGIYEVG